jgi:hypothetical protein
MRISNSFPWGHAAVLAGLLAISSTGCGGRKEAVIVDSKTAASNLDSAFKNAPSDVRTVVQSAAESIRNNDTASGFVALYGVTKNPELTPEQQRAAGDALMSSLKELSAAAKNGNARAEKALEAYRARK